MITLGFIDGIFYTLIIIVAFILGVALGFDVKGRINN
jgi:hypothetical protein